MRIGYACETDPDGLNEHDLEDLYFDPDPSCRPGLRELCENLRNSDVVVAYDRGQLGAGTEVARIERLIRSKGADIEYRPQPARPPQKPGPKQRFRPDYAAEKLCRRHWHGATKRAAALKFIRKKMGYEVQEWELNHFLGVRSKPKPWINSKQEPEGSD